MKVKKRYNVGGAVELFDTYLSNEQLCFMFAQIISHAATSK